MNDTATQEKGEKVGIGEVNFLELGAQPPDVSTQETEEETDTKGEKETKESSSQQAGDEKTEQKDDTDSSPDQSTTEEDETKKASEEASTEETKKTSVDTEEASEEPTIFESIATDIGVEISEEDLSGLNLEDPTQADLVEFTGRLSRKQAEGRFQEELDKYPETKKLYEYEKNGGDPEEFTRTFYPEVDYSQVEIVEDNEQQHEAIVRRHLQDQGFEAEEIDEQVNDFRDGGILLNQAKRSLSKLEQSQAQRKETLLQEQERKAKEQREQIQQQREQTKELIDKSERIAGIKIPKSDKEDFKNYLFQEKKDGYSQAVIDASDLSQEQRLAISYLIMKGFAFDDLISAEAESQNSRKVREMIKKSKEEPKGGPKETKSTEGDVEGIKDIF